MTRAIIRTSIGELRGMLVDVGAGGEAVIARACESSIICIDNCREEIAEARLKELASQWVLCDARYMPFSSKVFDCATLFFSLMYVKTPEGKHAVLKEIKRIMKSGGSLHVWDTIVEERTDPHVVQVRVVLPNGKEISAGYGVGGKGKEQNAWLVRKLAKKAGLDVALDRSHGNLLEFCFKA